MISQLLALTLSLADPLGFPAAPAPAAASPAQAALPAPATAPAAPRVAPPAPPPPLELPSSGPGLGNLLLPAAALLALAAAALFMSRKKKQEARLVQVLETTSLGPKRALVVARLGDELLVIGSSEAGLQLLAARSATSELAPRHEATPAESLAARLRPVPDLAPEPAQAPHPVLGLLSRLRRAPAPVAPEPSFDALLAESAEDQELRRKLANGQPGSVR